MSKKTREKKLLSSIKVRAQKRASRQTSHVSSAFDEPAFADLDVPEGFQPMSMPQALMTFAEPLMEHLHSDNIKEMDRAFGIAVPMWNYTLPAKTAELTPTKDEIIDQMCEVLGMDETDADDLFERMVARKAQLFPEAIQPKDPRTLFMRKDIAYEIVKFDESRLNLSSETIPPTAEDQPCIEDLRRLDQYLADGEEYSEWEEHYFAVERACCDRYFEWLTAKGAAQEHTEIFPFCIETYLAFVYRYSAADLIDISHFDLEAFFMDHLLRKVAVQPNEYVNWPPAIRLFYTFLSEKGYLGDPRPLMQLFDNIEPEFIEALKKLY